VTIVAGGNDADPFAVLGVPWTATLAEVREARRTLAFQLHPDHGGDVADMQRLNAAFDACVGHVTHRRRLQVPPAAGGETSAASGTTSGTTPPRGWSRPPAPRPRHIEQDAPSFTIDALPAEAFEALLVVASWIGEVLDDDPPYMLECHLHEPADCWCRLDLVPDAGGSTVSLMMQVLNDRLAGGTTPHLSAELVRDVWVDHLNRLGPLQPS
jgi:hypothetical protein